MSASLARWEYETTTLKEQKPADPQLVTDHMNERARAGWELVSASAVFRFTIDTEQARTSTGGPLGWGVVESRGALHHHFYWRRSAT